MWVNSGNVSFFRILLWLGIGVVLWGVGIPVCSLIRFFFYYNLMHFPMKLWFFLLILPMMVMCWHSHCHISIVFLLLKVCFLLWYQITFKHTLRAVEKALIFLFVFLIILYDNGLAQSFFLFVSFQCIESLGFPFLVCYLIILFVSIFIFLYFYYCWKLEVICCTYWVEW